MMAQSGFHWKRALTVSAIIAGIAVASVATIVLLFVFASEENPEGDGGLTGWPAVIGMGAMLLIALSFLAFIPAFLTAGFTGAGSTSGGRPPTVTPETVPTVSSAATPPKPRYSPIQAAPSAPEKAAERQSRAQRSLNINSLGERKIRRTRRRAIIMTLIALVTLGGVLTMFAGAEGDGNVAMAPWTILLIAAGLALGSSYLIIGFIRKATGRDKDQATYSKLFKQLPAERQRVGESLKHRSATESVQPIMEDRYRVKSYLGGAVKVPGGDPQDPRKGPLPYVSPWADALWKLYPGALFAREYAMEDLALKLECTLNRYVAPGSLVPAPAPTVLIDTGGGAVFFQQRNEFVLEDPEMPVRVVDLVLLGDNHRQENMSSPVTYLPSLQTTTYLETWFPADHWLHVYPDRRTRFNRFGGLGREIDASARQFNGLFDVRTDDPEWARLVLNPSVMRLLVDNAPIRLTVDAGRLIVHTHEAWLPPEEVARMAEVVRRIARSAESAEAR